MISKLNSVSYTNIAKQYLPKIDIQAQRANIHCSSASHCNLNNLTYSHYNKISFGIDDKWKKQIAKRDDGSLEYDTNRALIQGKDDNLDSNLEERMADQSKCFVDESRSICFYPEDIEKLNSIDNVRDRIEFLAFIRREKRYTYIDDKNK